MTTEELAVNRLFDPAVVVREATPSGADDYFRRVYEDAFATTIFPEREIWSP